MRRSNSGISPVVATVILVAVAIVIAIAVAFWASGLVGVFTRFEKIEIVSAYQSDDSEITIIVRNTGSTPTSIIQVVLNGVSVYDLTDPAALDVGQQLTCTITTGSELQAGVTYEVALKSSGGKLYPTTILASTGAGGTGTPTISDVACS